MKGSFGKFKRIFTSEENEQVKLLSQFSRVQDFFDRLIIKKKTILKWKWRMV